MSVQIKSEIDDSTLTELRDGARAILSIARALQSLTPAQRATVMAAIWETYCEDAPEELSRRLLQHVVAPTAKADA